MAANAHSSDSHHREGYDFAHPLPVWILLSVFFALTALTVITVVQANLDLGSIDIVLALGIATLKAILVMAFYMHLAYDKPFNLIIFSSSFVFVALFMIFTLMDARQNAMLLEPVVNEAPPVIVAPADSHSSAAAIEAHGSDQAAPASESEPAVQD